MASLADVSRAFRDRFIPFKQVATYTDVLSNAETSHLLPEVARQHVTSNVLLKVARQHVTPNLLPELARQHVKPHDCQLG